VFVGVLGGRPLVIAVGGIIALAMAVVWFQLGSQHTKARASQGGSLLEAGVMGQQIQALVGQYQLHKLSPESRWIQVQQWLLDIQGYAQKIVDQEPELTVDLLETLATSVDLAQQIAAALQAQGQVQTPTYQRLLQQRLKAAYDRLQDTHQQLQSLQDQVVLQSLDRASSPGNQNLPHSLKILIEANRMMLQTDLPPQS
jgi:hypothetical protein